MASEISRSVFKLLKDKGFPEEFCREIAYKYMNTEYTATRMRGYLLGYAKPSLEEVVDEMYAIISDRNRLIEKHEAERAQARINELYRNGL